MTGATSPLLRFGRFEVELELGEGPVGRVLVARDPVLGRRVTLKVVRTDLPIGPQLASELAARIRQEARVFAGVSHPGFATVLDLGEGEPTEPGGAAPTFVAFEFTKGPTLRERLAGGPLAPAEVAALGRALGAALAHAHAAGIALGDVKAENVVLAGTADAGARLVEPGFARLAWSHAAARRAAATWADALGPANGAPELLASGIPSPFSDQFALAAMLYEALTGKRPFGSGGTTETAERIAAGTREPPSLARPHLRSFPRLDAIFDRALARDPRKRFSSCDVLGSVLATELEGVESGRMSSPSVSSIVPRATRRWQNAAAGVAVLVILSLVVLGRQRRPSGDGASLRAVASAFAATLAPPRGSVAAPHLRVPRAAPSASDAGAPALPTQAASPSPEVVEPAAFDGAAATVPSSP